MRTIRKLPEFTVFPNIAHVRSRVLRLYGKGMIDEEDMELISKLFTFAKVVESVVPTMHKFAESDVVRTGLAEIMQAGDPEWRA